LAAVFVQEREQNFAFFVVVDLAIAGQVDESEGVVDRDPVRARRIDLSIRSYV
jgi:hypothetical protein